MYDVLIIGAGPAGVSASLYAKRANKNVLMLYHGASRLEKAKTIENYYGFPNGIDGTQLYRNGIIQSINLGVDVKEKEVLGIEMNADRTYSVKTKDESFSSKTVIIATGSKTLRPNIKGVKEFEGRGISYCAVCDGYFFKDKNVAVLGNGEYALSEAKELKNVAGKVTVFTNGLPSPEAPFDVITEKIAEIKGEARVSSIVLENGEEISVDGIFIALGIAGGADFAKKLGVKSNGDRIAINEKTATNLPGVFACGDLTGEPYQISKAVSEGALAGLAAAEYVNNLDIKE
jgi:thioredoxin reductase (NADPH)